MHDAGAQVDRIAGARGAPLYVWHMAMVLSSAVLMIPKSVIFACPARFTKMFAGLMSRWTCESADDENPETSAQHRPAVLGAFIWLSEKLSVHCWDGKQRRTRRRRRGAADRTAPPWGARRAIFLCVWRNESPSSTSLAMRLSTSSGRPAPAARVQRDSRDPASMNSIATEIWGRRGRRGKREAVFACADPNPLLLRRRAARRPSGRCGQARRVFPTVQGKGMGCALETQASRGDEGLRSKDCADEMKDSAKRAPGLYSKCSRLQRNSPVRSLPAPLRPRAS